MQQEIPLVVHGFHLFWKQTYNDFQELGQVSQQIMHHHRLTLLAWLPVEEVAASSEEHPLPAGHTQYLPMRHYCLGAKSELILRFLGFSQIDSKQLLLWALYNFRLQL
jgi:hypothetical protein